MFCLYTVLIIVRRLTLRDVVLLTIVDLAGSFDCFVNITTRVLEMFHDLDNVIAGDVV